MTAGDITTPDIQEADKVEDFFTLETGRPALVGRSKGSVEGRVSYKIADLSENINISRFAVQLDLRPDGRIIVSQPKLNLGSKEPSYTSKNKIAVLNENDEWVDVDDEFNAGVGGEKIKMLAVWDKQKKNGFYLSMGGNNQVGLDGVVVDGKKLGEPEKEEEIPVEKYFEKVRRLKEVINVDELSTFSGAEGIKDAWTKGLGTVLEKGGSYPGVFAAEIPGGVGVSVALLDAFPNNPRELAFTEHFLHVLGAKYRSSDGSFPEVTFGFLNNSSEGPDFKCDTKIEGVNVLIHYNKPPAGGYGTNVSLALEIRK